MGKEEGREEKEGRREGGRGRGEGGAEKNECREHLRYQIFAQCHTTPMTTIMYMNKPRTTTP